MAWVFDQPAAYIVAIPVLGVLAEIAPVVAGREQRLRTAQLAAIAAFGVLAFGTWAQPAISLEYVDSALYVGMAFAIGVPALALRRRGAGHVPPRPLPRDGAARAGLRRRRPAAARRSSVVPCSASIRLDLFGTTWQTAQADLIWVSAVTGGRRRACTGGRRRSGAVSCRHASGHVVGRPARRLGALLLAVPLAIAGALDQPVATFALEARDGVDALNGVAAAGAVLLVLAAVIAGYAVTWALSHRAAADVDVADPWGGQTLEWSTPSPPPVDNFTGDIDEVTSATPIFEDPGDQGGDDEESA